MELPSDLLFMVQTRALLRMKIVCPKQTVIYGYFRCKVYRCSTLVNTTKPCSKILLLIYTYAISLQELPHYHVITRITCLC